MVTTLGPLARGAGRAHAVPARRPPAIRWQRRMRRFPPWFLGREGGRRSAPFKQHDPGKAPKLLALLFRVEPAEQAPQPGEPHGPLEAQRLVPGGAKLGLAPAERSEELRALGRGELERR